MSTPVPHDLPSAEQPTRLSRRALRAQVAGIAVAAAQAAAKEESEGVVAVPEQRETALVAKPETPTAVVAAEDAPVASEPAASRMSRRQRRALAQSGASEPVELQSVEVDEPAGAPSRPAQEPHAPRPALDEATALLDEPPAPEVIAPPAVADAVAGEPAEPSSADPFLEAVRALGATGETPVAPAAAETAPSAEHVASGRRARPHRLRRVMATTTASLGVMGIVGTLAVGLTTPLGAIASPAGGENPAALTAKTQPTQEPEDAEDIQAFVAPADVNGEALEASSTYGSTTYRELAAAEGINSSGAAFTNDPTADIQWPFVVGVGISSPYGYRWGRLHEGVDFVPGEGAPVQAVADGTVRIATEAGGAYGVNVYIDHVIDGQLVTTHYAHMQYGSLRVVSGQRVEVGDIIGLTGNTGRSYGAHLHFEVIIGGSTIDPLPWLQQWAGTHYPDEPEVEPAGDDEAPEG